MRALLAGERDIIKGARVKHYLKVEVKDGDGTWQDWSAYAIGATWGETRDQPVSQATIRLRRKGAGAASLAPLMTDSTLNVYAGGYAPAIDKGRAVRISTATVAATTTPSTEYREMFLGRVDQIDWSQDPIVLSCSDSGAWLMDTQIETETQYAAGGGTAVQTVMQNILDGWPSGMGVPTLSTPASPGWNIKTYTQARVKVLEAIRALALQIGWDLRFRYDSSHVSKLTFYDPDRDSVTVHATIAASEYKDVQRLAMDISKIRNVGKVTFLKADGTVGSATHSVAGSITKHGRRYMELPAAHNIDTQTEADLYILSAIDDLSDAGAEQDIDMLYFWPVQLHDRYTFTANGVHYDDDQTWAVVGYTHTLENGHGRTTLQVAGRVIGQYETWLQSGGTDDSQSLIACPTITLAQLVHGFVESDGLQTHRVRISFTKPTSLNYAYMEFAITSDSVGDTSATQLSTIESPAAFIGAHPGVQYTITPTVVLKSGRKVVGTGVNITVNGTVYIGPTRIILPVGADKWATI